MFFLDTEYFLRNSFRNESGIPLPSQPIALTGVNYSLDQRETSVHFSLGGGGNLQLGRQCMENC